MFDYFKIESKVKEYYSVTFIDNLDLSLQNIASEDDIILIVDRIVFANFNEDFRKLPLQTKVVLIDANEKNKTLNYTQIIIAELIKLNIRKDSKLIAIGGGITQDIVAFISSIIFRGIDWSFLPTTLLAQCDSCIGSKSSINFDSYKNLLGTFNPPSFIYIYKGFLDTLTESEIRSGIGEMLHYFFTDGIDLAQNVTDQINELISDRKKLEYFIKHSLIIKKKIIEIDEFDKSIRHIFNYGHTFGHALEAICNYAIPHGQAITLGMDLANYISLKLKFIDNNTFSSMHNILIKNMPDFKFTETNIFSYLNALMKDKKNVGNKIGCILTKGPGKMEKVFINNDEFLRKFILEYSVNCKIN